MRAPASGALWLIVELSVAGARRHVDEQIIEIAPLHLSQKLRERAVHHRAAPDERFIVGNEKAHGHEANAAASDGLNAIALERLGALFLHAEHERDAGAVDVGVEKADLRAELAESDGEIHGDRALTDAALTARHRDDVLDVGQNDSSRSARIGRFRRGRVRMRRSLRSRFGANHDFDGLNAVDRFHGFHGRFPQTFGLGAGGARLDLELHEPFFDLELLDGSRRHQIPLGHGVCHGGEGRPDRFETYGLIALEKHVPF